MAGTYHLHIAQGADYSVLFACEDAAGAPLDLDPYVAKLQIRRRYEDEDVLVELTEGNGLTLGEDGQILVEISAIETAGLPAAVRQAVGVWDLELSASTGVRRLLAGKAYVSPEVTRA